MAQDEEELPPPKADFSAPPPYELVTSSNGTDAPVSIPMSSSLGDNAPNTTTQLVHQQQPPPQSAAVPQQHVVDMDQQQHAMYNVNVAETMTPTVTSKLPTYEEVQIEKTRLGEMPMDMQNNHNHHHTFPSVHGRIPPPSHPVLISALRNAHAQAAANGGPPGSVAVGPNGTLTFIAIESGDSQGRGHHSRHGTSHSAGVTTANVDNSLLGTDFMFLSAFLVAFLFNWIGFLMLTCFFHTIAARYGALSGFGLSLAKWTLIVKKSTDLASHDSSWLWWLIMSFGCLICVRALVQYVSIKKTWRMMSASAQERLLFFY